MDLDLSSLNWIALLVSLVVGQIVSTIWFVPIFGTAWAKAYGVADSKAHTKDVPPWTYAVGALCTFTLALSLALLQGAFGITTVAGALQLAAFVGVGIAATTMIPGQAFLRRWKVAAMTVGSQLAIIVAMSLVLVLMG